ncbi:MAG: hypothetical protein LC798_21410 [Chloroflexi bacterium]|nr:hypothetical protein [Chloroflexota bacterium]
MCFVDGEHTAEGVLRDARFCREVMGGQGTIAYHDRPILARGIADFTAELAAARVRFDAYPLPSELFVVELGEPRLLDGRPAVDRRSRKAAACWRRISRARGRATAIRALLLGEAGIHRVGRKAKRRARTVVARAPAVTRRPGGRD